MESQESRVDFKRLINILRRITLAVQIAPFVYSAIYILVISVYSFASDDILSLLDTLFYVSPFLVCFHLVYSKILHFCKWHRTACVVPLVPQIVNIIDYYVISFSEVEAFIFTLMIISMTTILIVSAYNVFFTDGCK